MTPLDWLFAAAMVFFAVEVFGLAFVVAYGLWTNPTIEIETDRSWE